MQCNRAGPFSEPYWEGIESILEESIRINNDDSSGKGDKTAFIDSTVQEKNITYPTDAKLHKKIIKRCQSIAETERLPLLSHRHYGPSLRT
jgi:IS5 family transposase